MTDKPRVSPKNHESWAIFDMIYPNHWLAMAYHLAISESSFPESHGPNPGHVAIWGFKSSVFRDTRI